MTKHEAQRSGGTYIGHVSQGRLTTAVLPSSIGRLVLQRGLSRILNKEDGWALGVMYDECNPPQGSKLGVRRRRGAGQFGCKLAIHRRRACSYGLFPHPRFFDRHDWPDLGSSSRFSLLPNKAPPSHARNMRSFRLVGP